MDQLGNLLEKAAASPRSLSRDERAELLSLELLPADLRDTDTRLSATTVARLPEAVMRGETRDTLSLPFITQGLSVANALLDENTSLEQRRFPLVLSSTAGTVEALSLTLGEETLVISGNEIEIKNIAKATAILG